jgi:23S rRNA pseudouridine2605 synthase
VQVNGETSKIGDFADPDTDDIVADGDQVAAEQKRYLLLNKPTGFVTTVTDPHGRPTVMDLVDVRERVYPIGRLDTDTEGLLLLTNDGNFSQRMAHPRFEIEKTYRAELRSPLSTEGEMLLARGIRLEDGPTAPAKLRVVSKRRRRVDITIHEGRNRIVRRMFESVGSPVTRLRRISFGTLDLDDVPKGRWRELQGKEVDALLKLAAEMVRPKRRQRPTRSVVGPRAGGDRSSRSRRATSGAKRS